HFWFQDLYNKFFELPKPAPYLAYLPMYIEQWIRYVWIWFKKMKGDIVYTDRWPGYNSLHKGIKNNFLHTILYTVFPGPNRFVFLSATPEKICARKPELTCEQITITQEK